MIPFTRSRRLALWLALASSLGLVVAACVSREGGVEQRMWWGGLGPVLPHDTFPANCSLCHVGTGWQSLAEDFHFEHELETGYALHGAHARAACLRCHNDRGPVTVFAAQGCGGCHEDIHFGQLGADCASCHQEENWRPVGQLELHARTRFPLLGVHASTACHRCHPGAEVGKFLPTDTECVTCHQSDLFRANNPNHIALGWVDRCDRCHLPRTWQQAEID